VARPEISERDTAAWAACVYDRTNPRGSHQEYWHHVHGCRQWMVVGRDTQTHEVSGARLVGPWAEREAD
jgi:sarcosine oxidase subunit delta